MATIVVPDESKTPVEALLLGDVTIAVTDCDGQQVEVHGLLGNHLMYKLVDGSVVPLKDALSTGNIAVSSSTITLTKGGQTTVQQIADSVNEVQFEIADLQTKYNNL